MVLVVGIFGDVLIGDRRYFLGRIPHPVVVMGGLVSLLDRRWNVARESGEEGMMDEGERIRARRRGLYSLWVIILVSGGFGYFLWWVCEEVGLVWGEVWSWILEGLCLSVLLAGRSLYEHVSRVGVACEGGDLGEMQKSLQMIVSRRASLLDRWGVARGAFESLSDNYVDGVLSPLFWWVLFGLPGIFVYKMVNTADSMVGYHGWPYGDYGRWVARADDVMNAIPARLGALSVMLGGFLMRGASGLGAWRMLRLGEMHAHRSPSAGWPEAAFAGALGLRLGGERVYPGEIRAEHWVGRGREEVTGGDIRKGLRLYMYACVVHFVFLWGLYMFLVWLIDEVMMRW